MACLISSYTANEKERVIGKGGISCNDTLLSEISNTSLR